MYIRVRNDTYKNMMWKVSKSHDDMYFLCLFKPYSLLSLNKTQDVTQNTTLCMSQGNKDTSQETSGC